MLSSLALLNIFPTWSNSLSGIFSLSFTAINSSRLTCPSALLNLADKTKVIIPKSGDKKQIVDLSLKNAKHFRINQFEQRKYLDPQSHYKRILNQKDTP